MANEIYARIQFIWDYKLSVPLINYDVQFRDDALTGTRYNLTLQSVSTSWEALEIGDLAKQWMLIQNLDDTNFVSWGKSVADATELIRIPPETAILIYVTAVAPAVRADTAACDINIIGVEGSG